jgi:KEOPS complex subunit Cgi121
MALYYKYFLVCIQFTKKPSLTGPHIPEPNRLLREPCTEKNMFAAFRQSVQDPQKMVSHYGKSAALFNPELVAGFPHLEFARLHTDTAFERGENIARGYGIEFLVRLSGRNQIEKALDIGVNKGTFVGVLAEKEVLETIEADLKHRDDSLFELTKEKEVKIQQFFQVSGCGKTLQKRIFEKIALLPVY